MPDPVVPTPAAMKAVLNTKTKGDVEKAHISDREEYLATVFLISSDRRQYGDLILLLKNDYAK